MVDFGNFSSPDSFKNDAFVYFLFRPTRVTFQRIFSLESVCGLGGTVVRRRAHNPRVVCSIPALATFEDSILGQGVNTNCASLHPRV